MKAAFTLAVTLLISFSNRAQNVSSTTLNILNASGAGRPITFQTRTSQPIVIRPKHWAIIRLIKSDSLTLVTNKQTVSIPFERGKHYYFLASSDYSTTFVVTAKSEQEFLLALQFNNAEKPEEYIGDK